MAESRVPRKTGGRSRPRASSGLTEFCGIGTLTGQVGRTISIRRGNRSAGFFSIDMPGTSLGTVGPSDQKLG